MQQLNRDQLLNLLRRQIDEIKRKYGVRKMVLFGSFARNEATEKSDVDILVEMEPSFENFFDLQNYLKALTGREIDLGTKLRRFVERHAKQEMIEI